MDAVRVTASFTEGFLKTCIVFLLGVNVRDTSFKKVIHRSSPDLGAGTLWTVAFLLRVNPMVSASTTGEENFPSKLTM